jgi:hypothetical protein
MAQLVDGVSKYDYSNVSSTTNHVYFCEYGQRYLLCWAQLVPGNVIISKATVLQHTGFVGYISLDLLGII